MSYDINRVIIYYVDDEQKSLTVFEETIMSMTYVDPETKEEKNRNYECITFSDPTKCLAKLKELKERNEPGPWILISDQLMPQMKGVDFLKQTIIDWPKTRRIMLTGHSNEELVMQSVNEARIDEYIKKPWDIEKIEQIVEKYIEQFINEEIIPKYRAIFGGHPE